MAARGHARFDRGGKPERVCAGPGVNVVVECTPFRIDGGEIRHAPNEAGGVYVHVVEAPADHALVISALQTSCAVPLPLSQGRYVVGWHVLKDAKPGVRVVATRFEG